MVLHDLATAEEVYISNAVIGLIPVTKILKIREDYPGVKGSKLIEIRKAYRRFLESTLT
jgi:branched-subunit amino acid aminotransferase/4-amino-4-deoxychorismate lyase